MTKFNMTKREPTSPGRMLQIFIDEYGTNQTKLAKILGWSHARVNEIVNNKRGITIEAALCFADVFSNSAEFWLNCQQKWALWHGLQKHQSKPALQTIAS